jgi:hypothetical protein
VELRTEMRFVCVGVGGWAGAGVRVHGKKKSGITSRICPRGSGANWRR